MSNYHIKHLEEYFQVYRKSVRNPEGFWEEERNIMLEHFRQQAYGEGVATVIRQIGEKLQTFFPYQDDDVNELPDEISYE